MNRVSTASYSWADLSIIDIERPAWIIAISTWVVGDLVSTAIAMSLGGHEMHPIAAPAIDTLGAWVIVPMQLLALGVFVGGWLALRARGRIERVGIPIGLSLLGSVIVVNNLVVIAALI